VRKAQVEIVVIEEGRLAGYEPGFIFHGFRCAQIDGWTGTRLERLDRRNRAYRNGKDVLVRVLSFPHQPGEGEHELEPDQSLYGLI
jgi:hypothetical protein